MDFDEYDYLEKTVENPESLKLKEISNGTDESLKSGENERSRSSRHRNDDNSHDLDHRSKRTKSGDEIRDPERPRDRGSSHHRSSSKDVDRTEKERHRSSRDYKEKSREKDREEGNGREGYKDRDRRERDQDPGRNRDRREQDREGERDREKGRKERDRETVRDKEGRERDRERSRRSTSRSEKHRSRDDNDLERNHYREIKEKEKEKEVREREKEMRRHKEKKDDVQEPEADPERDQRTVFAYQISLKADERDVYEFFSRAGKVRDVRLIMDRNSRRSKGVGYIEFYDAMSVPMAIALSGQHLLSQPVMVKPSEAEKNLVQSTATATSGPSGLLGSYAGGARKLYVGNLHFNITEDQLRQVFEPFGTVELVQLPLDQETGHCKGFGFVQFARIDDAKAAQSLNGQLEIAGRVIKVSAVTDQAGMQDIGAIAADFDDDEGGGLSLNARSRAMLMQKLDRTGTASSFAGGLGAPVNTPVAVSAPIFGAVPPTMASALVPPLLQSSVGGLAGLPAAALPASTMVPTVDMIGVPSECLLLKNMFDPTKETEPDFDLDIKEDVEDECKKFGRLRHIYVEKESVGFVYLRFEDTQSALNAQRALHGRWFAGKMITATYMLPQNYESKFPDC